MIFTSTPDPKSPDDREALPLHRHHPLEVDWLAIRVDYEMTNTSIRALARHHGLKSDFAIRRRIREQGWERDIDAINERLALRSVALTAAPESVEQPEDADSPQRNDAPAILRRGSIPSSRDRDTSTARGRAAQHQRFVAEQLDAANHARDMAMAVLDQIHTLMHAEVGSPEFGVARTRLRALSAGKETLADLAKAAGTVLEGAVVVERRALAMDRAGGTAQQNPMASRVGRNMTKVSKRLMN